MALSSKPCPLLRGRCVASLWTFWSVDEAAAVPDEDYFGILPALIATQGEQVLLYHASR